MYKIHNQSQIRHITKSNIQLRICQAVIHIPNLGV